MSVSKYSSDLNLDGVSIFEGGKPHQHKRRFSIINAGILVQKNDQIKIFFKKPITENSVINPNQLKSQTSLSP
jgi:hypothetical protein